MNKDNIELPPLHYDELPEPDDTIPAMHNYARRAIKADRQQRHLKERAQLNQEWAALKGMQEQYEADRQQRSETLSALAALVNALRDRHYGRMPDEVQAAYDRAWSIVYASPQPVTSAQEPSDDVIYVLKLALEYWTDRQQRYRNRAPVWVQEARGLLAHREKQE